MALIRSAVNSLQGIFGTGMAIGSFLYAYTDEPMQVASNDTVAAISHVLGAPQTARQ